MSSPFVAYKSCALRPGDFHSSVSSASESSSIEDYQIIAPERASYKISEAWRPRNAIVQRVPILGFRGWRCAMRRLRSRSYTYRKQTNDTSVSSTHIPYSLRRTQISSHHDWLAPLTASSIRHSIFWGSSGLAHLRSPASCRPKSISQHTTLPRTPTNPFTTSPEQEIPVLSVMNSSSSSSSSPSPPSESGKWSVSGVKWYQWALGIGGLIGLGLGIDLLRFAKSIEHNTFNRWKALTCEQDQRPALGGHAGEPTVIYDVRGRVVATLSTDTIPLSQVADPMWQAVVASEDHRFFTHSGIDVRGVTRAIGSLGRQGGGSTITQQLVKNVLLNQSRTVSRKVVEIVMSMVLERSMSKPRIIESYLNCVYFGHGLTGIAQASAAYFHKKPSQLTVAESSLLAALLPAPEYLTPYRHPEAALRARNQVLTRMCLHGFITNEQLEQEKLATLPNTLAISPTIPEEKEHLINIPQSGGSGAPYRAPYFVSEVLYQLRQICGPELLKQGGGLQIYTTLDLALQERAEQLLYEDGLTKFHGQPKGEAALVASDPQSGAVRVMVGGRDYSKSPYNRAVMARRSPGSAFKPVVFLSALDSGMVSPSTELIDEEVIFEVEGQADYRPQNYSRKYRGTVTMRDSLADSLNIPTVKLCDMVGVDTVIQMAHKLGIRSHLSPALSIALGACEVSPLEMASAYNTIAARGVYSRPHLVLKVKDRTGATIYRHHTVRQEVVSRSAAEGLHRMLRAAVTQGTGKAAASGWPSAAAAGKTGTSDDYRDAWFAGYTPAMSCVVWVGKDDNSPLPGTGASLAAPIWGRFMRAASGAGIPVEKGVTKRRVSRWRSIS